MVGDYNRYISWKKALRKQRIDKNHLSFWGSQYYNNLHQYSKNKIHCSAKSRNKGDRRTLHANYAASLNWKKSDKIKIDKLKNSEEYYYEEN